MILAFLSETADRGLEKIKWARANGIPIVYHFLVRDDADDLEDLPNHYRGSRWMVNNFEVPINAVGEPGYTGGSLMIRDRDMELWILRWGHPK